MKQNLQKQLNPDQAETAFQEAKARLSKLKAKNNVLKLLLVLKEHELVIKL